MKDVKEKLERISINNYHAEMLLNLLRDEMTSGTIDSKSMEQQCALVTIITEKINEVNKMIDELEYMVVKNSQIEIL